VEDGETVKCIEQRAEGLSGGGFYIDSIANNQQGSKSGKDYFCKAVLLA